MLDALNSRYRGREVSLESVEDLAEDWGRSQARQPDEVTISAEEHEQLWRTVQTLPSHYRVPLVLRYYEDFSLHEIATLTGKREGTIRVIIHRALHQLRLLSNQKTDVEQNSLSRFIKISQP